MLSAKYTKIHGMRNEKWNTREKIQQYRSILKLHARDKKLQATNGIKLKRKVSRNLKELEKDTQDYREILKDIIYGDKRIIRTVIQTEKHFRVLLKDAEPSEAYEAVFEDYNLKRRQLDKLLYVKEKKRDAYCCLQSEYSQLTESLEHKDEISELEVKQLKRQQQLIARYQNAIAKQNAAKSIAETFRELLETLKKDSMYFDGVLRALKMDQRDQCKVIYKTTLMGQIATEDLDDIRIKYKKLANDIWVNMKERERSLEITRKRAEDIWEYAKSLVRIESDTNLANKKDDAGTKLDKKLQKQIEHLEDIFNRMKDTMLIRSYEELFARLEDQVKQRERLSKLYKHTMKERDFVLNKKKHAELALKNLEHSVVSTTTRYKVDKKAMLEKIKEEKKRVEDNKSMIESRGDLLMKIRTALQNMASALVCVSETRFASKGKKLPKEIAEKTDETEVQEENKICDDPVESQGLALLSQVSKKAVALFAQANFTLSAEREEKAKDLYSTYICNHYSKLKFDGKDDEAAGMHFEHEAVDTSIPTRAYIKMKSKQVVEANTKED